MRVGIGYDIHPLIPGRPFVMGGVVIPFDKGPQGHSDGDVLLHAVTDALLGAAGLGDIGYYFSDTDPRWKNATSEIFLREALRLVREKGWTINNLDANVLVEKPKIGPYRDLIRENISRILDVPVDRINLKGKRGEGLDAVGRNEAVIAQVVVLLS